MPRLSYNHSTLGMAQVGNRAREYIFSTYNHLHGFQKVPSKSLSCKNLPLLWDSGNILRMKEESSTVIESVRPTPVATEVDVCVIGGSCTGVFAALRAAEAGMKVAVVENNGFFGGTATAGLVPVWHLFLSTDGKREIIKGLSRQLLDHLVRHGQAVVHNAESPTVFAYLSSTGLITALDEAISGNPLIRPFLHARFIAVVKDGDGRLTHAVIEDKTGRRAIAAKFFIDASGDADLLQRAGFETWRPKKHLLQPHTTCVMLSGVNEVKAAHPEFSLGEMMRPERGAGLKHVFMWGAPVVGAPGLTFGAVSRVHNCDPSDADDLTAGEIEGRRQMASYVRACNREFPVDGAGVHIASFATSMGVRESRHARCLYSLTEDDVLRGRVFEDAAAYGSYRVDIHHDGGITFKNLDGKQEVMNVDPATGKVTWERGRWLPEGEAAATFYQIPYRSLVPRGSVNVLCAGRMLDCDRGAYGASRVMVNCNQMGEATGVAATRYVKEGVPVESAWKGLEHEAPPTVNFWPN